jgi:hypothetical protein
MRKKIKAVIYYLNASFVLATYKQAVMLGSLSHLHGVSSCVQVSDQVLNKLVTEELNKAIFRQILHGGNGKHSQSIYK